MGFVELFKKRAKESLNNCTARDRGYENSEATDKILKEVELPRSSLSVTRKRSTRKQQKAADIRRTDRRSGDI